MGEAAESSDSRHSDSDSADSGEHDDRTLEDRVESHEVQNSDAKETRPTGKILKFSKKSSSNYKNDGQAYEKPTEQYSSDENHEKIYRNEHNTKSSKSGKGKRVDNYAVAVIYHIDDSGRVFFLLEENDENYGFVEERNKIRPPGGTGEPHDQTTYHTLKREFREEIPNPAGDILIRRLEENGKYLGAIVDEYEDYISKTDIYSVQVISKNDWEKVSSTRFTDDAGYPRILSLEDIITSNDSTFAYVYGPVLKKIASQIGHFGNGGHHYSIPSYSEKTVNFNSYKPATAPSIKPLEYKIAA